MNQKAAGFGGRSGLTAKLPHRCPCEALCAAFRSEVASQHQATPNRRVAAFVAEVAQSIFSAKCPKRTESAEEEKSAGKRQVVASALLPDEHRPAERVGGFCQVVGNSRFC